MPVLLKPTAMAPPVPHTAEPSGMIEIIIGDAVVRLHAGIDAALLQLVLQSLRP
jgi:transposase